MHIVDCNACISTSFMYDIKQFHPLDAQVTLIAATNTTTRSSMTTNLNNGSFISSQADAPVLLLYSSISRFPSSQLQLYFCYIYLSSTGSFISSRQQAAVASAILPLIPIHSSSHSIFIYILKSKIEARSALSVDPSIHLVCNRYGCSRVPRTRKGSCAFFARSFFSPCSSPSLFFSVFLIIPVSFFLSSSSIFSSTTHPACFEYVVCS